MSPRCHRYTLDFVLVDLVVDVEVDLRHRALLDLLGDARVGVAPCDIEPPAG